MIIQLPPAFLDPIKNICVVMSILSKPIMDHNRMKLIWSLFIFHIWLFTLFFKSVNFGLQILQFSFCAFSVLTEDSLSHFDFSIGNAKSILMKLVDIKMCKLLSIHNNRALQSFMILRRVFGYELLTIMEFLNDIVLNCQLMVCLLQFLECSLFLFQFCSVLI